MKLELKGFDLKLDFPQLGKLACCLMLVVGLCTPVSAQLTNAKKKELEKSDKYKKHNSSDHTLDDRFEVTLFAGPPYVEYVTAVSADLDGTLYVSVDPNGSLGKIKGKGKVVSLKDTNGDGKADRFVDFIPHVSSPRGGHIVAGTYYLIHPPYLSKFEDINGDGKSDKKTLLVKGFGGGIEHPRGADHTTNGVRMGIDGWLYVSVGDFGMTDAKGTDGKVVQLYGGGVARLRPDGSEMEVIVHNTRNQFDTAISPTMELFTRDNTNDGKGWNLRVHHLVHEADMGYPRLYQNFPDEHLASLADYGGGSGMGCLFLDEPGFPKDLNDKLYTCDWTSNMLFKHDLKPADGTYEITQSIFSKLEKATDVDVDGKSQLYLADWKGGRFKYAGDNIPISRIQMARLKNYKAPKVPDLAKAGEAELIKHLTGPSSTTRLQAQQYLLKKGLSKSAISQLEKVALDSGKHVYIRTAALYTLKQGQGAGSHALCTRLLLDDAMRVIAMRVLTDRKGQLKNVSPDLFIPHLSRDDPRVRLQAAISLRRLNKFSAGSLDALIDMAVKSWDKDSVGSLGVKPLPHLASRALSAIGQSSSQARAHFIKRFKAGDLKTQKALSYGMKTVHDPEMIDALLNMLGARDLKDDSRLIVLDILARLAHKEKPWDLKAWWGTRPFDEGPYFAIQTWQYTQPIIGAIEREFGKFSQAAQLNALDILSLNQIDPTKLKFEGVNALFDALESNVPSKQRVDLLKSAAMDQSRPWDLRLKAAEKLLVFHNHVDPNLVKPGTGGKKKKGKKKKVNPAQLKKQMDAYKKKLAEAAESRLYAAKALTTVLGSWRKNGKMPRKAEGMLHDYWTQPPVIKDDLKPLVKLANQVSHDAATLIWKKLLYATYRPVGGKVDFLASAIEGKESLHNSGYYQAIVELGLTDSAFKSRASGVLNWDNEHVRKSAKAVVDMVNAGSKVSKDAAKGELLSAAGMEKATAYALKQKGDIKLGEKLFNMQGCVTCHAVNNEAIQKGPYLGTAGSQFDRKFLIESILNPAAAIAQGFPTYTLNVKRGPSPVMGFLIAEDNVNHYIMNIGGQITEVKREFVREKKLMQISQMPPGLVSNLNMHEFTSLIEYLVSMK